MAVVNKIVLILLIIACYSSAISQTKTGKVDIKWGNEVKASRKMTLDDVIGYDKTGLFILQTKRRGGKYYPVIEHYDNNINQTKSVEVNMEQGGKVKEYEFMVYFNSKIYLFSSFINRKLKKNFLFYQTINKQTLQVNNDLNKIAEIDYSGYSKYNAGYFNFRLSRDTSKLLVQYNLPYEKNNPEKYGFHVFDKNMNQLWEKKVTLPYKDVLFDVEHIRVDNNANAYVLGPLYKEKAVSKRKGAPNFNYRLLSYKDSGKDEEEYTITLEDRFLTDMQIAIAENGDIICAGFYSEKGTFSIKGTYFLTVDNSTKEIKQKSFKEFGIDFITQNLTERKAEKAKKKAEKIELYEYGLDNIVLREDGGAVLVGEQFYIKVATHYYTDANGNARTTASYHYYYNDIIVVNMNPEGAIDWAIKIPKMQHTVNDNGYFSSYAMAIVKGKLYFVFNDNPKNLLNQQEGKTYNFIPRRESLVVLVEVNGAGEQSKAAMFSSKETDIITRPKVCRQIDEKTCILFGERGKMHRFAKVVFK